MGFKRRAEPTVEDEREALRAQHAALEELKHELAERVQAVQQRELELSYALAEAGGARPEPSSPPDAAVQPQPSTNVSERFPSANRPPPRSRRTSPHASASSISGPSRSRRHLLRRRLELLLLSRTTATDARLAELDARLAELRDAEALFLRTRDELAGRSEAVAARERLVAQRERELDDREDGKGQWARPELSEMEARLRRLEQQQPGEQTLGFSGGFRKLEQGSRPQRGG